MPSPAADFLHNHGRVRLRVTLMSFDTVGDRIMDMRLLALKDAVENQPYTVFEAVSVLNQWVAVLGYSSEAGTIDRLPAERCRNIMKAWVDEFTRALRQHVGEREAA